MFGYWLQRADAVEDEPSKIDRMYRDDLQLCWAQDLYRFDDIGQAAAAISGPGGAELFVQRKRIGNVPGGERYAVGPVPGPHRDGEDGVIGCRHGAGNAA